MQVIIFIVVVTGLSVKVIIWLHVEVTVDAEIFMDSIKCLVLMFWPMYESRI